MNLVSRKENRIVKLKKKITGAHERKPFGDYFLKTDEKIKFYTGIPTKKAFDEKHQMLLPTLKKMKHCHGPSKVSSPLKKHKTTKSANVGGRPRKFDHKNEFF